MTDQDRSSDELPKSVTSSTMPVLDALRILAVARPIDATVVTNQTSARLWPVISQHARDFNYNPSTMGGAIPFALGLALARPQHEVIVVSGDGSLLMSLGCLVTVIAAGVRNLSIVLLANGSYEVTGGQKTPATGGPCDFVAVARAAGFTQVSRFYELSGWESSVHSWFRRQGPRFACLEVSPAPHEALINATPPITQQLQRLRQSFGHSK